MRSRATSSKDEKRLRQESVSETRLPSRKEKIRSRYWEPGTLPTDAGEVARLVESIRPLLAGHPPDVQGAALAELLATWLAGHWIPESAADTHELRESLLVTHLSMVRKLTSVNAALLGTE
jgi:hypothetical protein